MCGDRFFGGLELRRVPSKHARSGQCWPSVGRVGKTSANLPTLCQCFANTSANAVIIVVVSFLEFFHDCVMILGHFLLLIAFQFAKNTFFLLRFSNVGRILAQHRLPTSALCISANTGPTLDSSPRPTLVDKIFLNYQQFFVINLGFSFQKC